MTRYLLDTHIILWRLNEPFSLRPEIRSLLDDHSNDRIVSVASLWEAAIKVASGKLQAPPDLPQVIEGLGWRILPVTSDHAWAIRSLPLLHGDPFDRLLVTQAFAEDATLVTHDQQMSRYGCKILLA